MKLPQEPRALLLLQRLALRLCVKPLQIPSSLFAGQIHLLTQRRKGAETQSKNSLRLGVLAFQKCYGCLHAHEMAISVSMRICLLFLAAFLVTGCSKEQDWDMVSCQDIHAPGGSYVATVFEMSCYCTTGDFPQISLRRPKEKLGKNGNVLAGGPGDRITARWLSSTNLLVEYHTCSEWPSYPPATTNIGGITINFKKL